MPLSERLPVFDTIAGFEAARENRFRDSLSLRAGGRRHGSVYFLGYSIEMTLKCVFLKLLGFSHNDPIRSKDLAAAADLARSELGVSPDNERLHSLRFWGEAIVAIRTYLGDPSPTDALRDFVSRCHRMHANWRVSMRYVRDLVLLDELNSLSEDAAWI